jgi:hypothetical protein
MINPTKLFKIKSALGVFTQNHPKFQKYLEAVRQNALQEGTVIEFNVTTADGQTLNSNIKLTQSDIELLQDLSELSHSL